MNGIHELLNEIKKLKQKKKNVYIYGHGVYGKGLYTILKGYHIEIAGYVVTRKTDSEIDNELPVFQIEDVINKSVGLILAINEKSSEEVLKLLKKLQFDMNAIVNGGRYIQREGHLRGNNNGFGSIEISTIMGCRVNCKYCPQDVLLKNYYKNNPNRERLMSLTTFENTLKVFPIQRDLAFGGMSEPFLNDHFMQMLRIACKQNRKINLFTTLEGIEEKYVDEILEMPISYCILHIADEQKFAKITIDDKYYSILKKFVSARKIDGSPFVNRCNAQTEPDKIAKSICKENNYEIFTAMTDRAGNLDDGNLIAKSVKKGKIRCSNYGTGLNNNVILPDGTVVLCCMDYGLKHVLGNVNRDSYETIINSEELNKVMQGLNGDESKDILCRRCSFASPR